jgi:energy-coupling factor transporter ATP-binding protein EcfA2
MTGVSISSDHFSKPTYLEFFPRHAKPPKKNRVALLYGRNGSGKSMIAQGFREYRDSVIPRTVALKLTDGTSDIGFSPGEAQGKIFIFDEEYITNRVKVDNSGLDAIVLFGDQVALDEQIEKVQGLIEKLEIKIQEQEIKCGQFTDKINVNSPDYWTFKIQDKLRESNGWAEIGSKIHQHKHNLKVTEKEIEEIGSIFPTEQLEDLLSKREILLAQYSAAASSSTPLSVEVTQLNIIRDFSEKAKALLKKVVEKPQLTDRETKLLQLFGVNGAEDARSFISTKENNICNKCFQPISDEYRARVLKEIERILNRDVTEFKGELKELLFTESPFDTYKIYRDLPSYENVRDCLDGYSKAIMTHNSVIRAKIDNPFEPKEYEGSMEIMTAYEAANNALNRLEADRISYNRSITERSSVKKELIDLNNDIAHYAIKGMYSTLQTQKTAKQNAANRLCQLKDNHKDLTGKKIELDSQRKNFTIAADEINRALEYIFFSKKRLSLELGPEQLYHLKVNGNEVRPNKVSCGERNALALCYFFTEIVKDMDAKALYSDEILLIIDDPVSSFDMENRVGIMSFLRWKLGQILSRCATTKILIMTHDIGVMFDLRKAMKEISDKKTSVNAECRLFRLEGKCLSKFQDTHNEYTQLLQIIYQYATSAVIDNDIDLVIGNVMRRVLEAFAAFSFKLSITKVSLDERVLKLMSEGESIYYRNLMYRLVLHNESHFEENIQGAPEMSFFSFLSPDEKRRTAKDILCFIHRLNKSHILSHLPDAEQDLTTWCSNIAGLRTDLKVPTIYNEEG